MEENIIEQLNTEPEIQNIETETVKALFMENLKMRKLCLMPTTLYRLNLPEKAKS